MQLLAWLVFSKQAENIAFGRVIAAAAAASPQGSVHAGASSKIEFAFDAVCREFA
jgi:hypothetical protein